MFRRRSQNAEQVKNMQPGCGESCEYGARPLPPIADLVRKLV
jgi:hypothetical protein